jgi:hypothetical protein
VCAEESNELILAGLGDSMCSYTKNHPVETRFCFVRTTKHFWVGPKFGKMDRRRIKDQLISIRFEGSKISIMYLSSYSFLSCTYFLLVVSCKDFQFWPLHIFDCLAGNCISYRIHYKPLAAGRS